MSRSWTWGPAVAADGARFRLWAPAEREVRVRVRSAGASTPCARDGDGWFEATVPGARAGDAYAFVLSDGLAVPDPAARAQVGEVHGPSRLVDPDAYHWRAALVGPPVGRGGDQRDPRRRLHARGHLPGGGGPARPARRARDHRDRDDAGGAVRRETAAGATTACCLYAPPSGLRHAGRAEGAGRRRARSGADGAARRRLQPLRPGRELPRAAMRRTSSTPTGTRPGARPSPTSARRSARVLHRERALLARGVPLRRAAARRRRPRPRPRLGEGDPRRARRGGARRLPGPAGAPDAPRTTATSPACTSARRTARRGSTPPSGTTTSTTSPT